MKNHRKFLVVSSFTVSMIIVSFVLAWGNWISKTNGQIILSILMVAQMSLVLLVTADLVKNRKRKRLHRKS